ncbi:FAD-binding domain-containing protein [Methylophilus sp. DW102]|uniref:FAD-binding domain-containing protein n=1 Tax=Methylophilus sp. DW102 TaxID=3095607 RepID=UPI003086634E|nr:DNA photolyase [Methylophilus sp. DW102]
MTQPPVRLTLATDRRERLAQIRTCFPQANGPDLDDRWQGGRVAALQRLSAIDAEAYGHSRNHLQGAVTRLSPYLRHGCLSLQEAVTVVRQSVGNRGIKLIAELSYRDYFRQVWYRFGEAIKQPMEAPKVALGDHPLPAFIEQGFTGLVCMDEIVRSLRQEGYLHNHARMWFAAYVLHWLKVDWRQAADWFEQQLLDGDWASNHLSWQWIGASFSHKPYFFNKENIVKFGGDPWCQQCHVRCPFDASYETLQQQLFSALPPQTADQASVASNAHMPLEITAQRLPSHDDSALIWLHDEMLSPEHALLKSKATRVFAFDPALYGQWPLKRLQFMADCLSEIPEADIWIGSTAQVLASYSQRHIISQNTPNAQLKAAADDARLTWLNEPSLYDTCFSDHELMRFSRYWKKVEPLVFTNDDERFSNDPAT